jgi:N-acetylneuraminate lyase
MAEHLTGLVAAPFTPMTEDGAIRFEAVDTYPSFLADNGCSGAFVNGTTGESLSLTVGERCQIAERWVARAPEDFAVIVQVGHNCLAECKTMAAHAQDIGAAAVGMMAPCFFRPETMHDLVAFCAEVAEAAPELPFYYYHLPGKTFVNFPMVDFLDAAAGVIPTLKGIKYTFEDLADLGQCIDVQGGRFNLLFGRDEALLGALAIGAKGAVGSTYNLCAPLYCGMIDSFEAGDLAAAQADQGRSRDMVAVFKRHGALPAFKAGMELIGFDCGPVRLPQRALTSEQTETLRADLDAIGFFDYCCKT